MTAVIERDRDIILFKYGDDNGVLLSDSNSVAHGSSEETVQRMKKESERDLSL